MTIIPANTGTYLVSAEHITGDSGKIVGGFAFYQNAIVGWRVREDYECLEPITLTSVLDREPIDWAVLLPGGNVETFVGGEYATLKDWQRYLIEECLPKLNARAQRRTKEEKEILSSSGSEDF